MDEFTYIGKDTYTGTHVVWGAPKGHKVTVWESRELAQFATGGVVVLFESFGHVNGREGFTRTRFMADPEGNLHGYDGEGARKIIHPADRKLRVLTK
jgi:hypothetical protein